MQITDSSFYNLQKMKRIVASCMAPAIFLFIIAGCYYDNEEALYPELNAACDTTSISFTGTIEPLLNNNCWSCHSDATAAFGGGIHLQALADVKTNSSKILASISHTGPKPMPPNGRLKPCSVSQFAIWMRNGMP